MDFKTLDFGSGDPASVEMETIQVVLSCEETLEAYGRAFVEEGYRKAPLIADHVGLTANEMKDYCAFLLAQRIGSVHGDCPLFRKLKLLWIPSWIQFGLSQIGFVTVRDYGLRLEPVTDGSKTISYDEALAISEKIAAFEPYLQVVRDAMPRAIDGDIDTMSKAIIGGYVRSFTRTKTAVSTYVSAFWNAHLQEENIFKMLYRVQYDDVGYIRAALTSEKGII